MKEPVGIDYILYMKEKANELSGIPRALKCSVPSIFCIHYGSERPGLSALWGPLTTC